MKRTVLIGLLAGLCGLSPVSAQDIILLREASEIEAEVTEIDDSGILYRRFGDSLGPLRRISRDSVFKITYANGEREVFLAESTARAAGYPWPSVSRSYAVGELFQEGDVVGIVIHTTDGGRHGVIVSLDMKRAPFFKFCCGILIGLSDRQDGWRNMRIMESFVRESGLQWSDFPAYAWCRSLGPGWYLPAIDEMHYLGCFADEGNEKELYRMLRNMGRACEVYGGAGFGPFSGMLLSSTERETGVLLHLYPDRPKGVSLRDHSWMHELSAIKAFHRF